MQPANRGFDVAFELTADASCNDWDHQTAVSVNSAGLSLRNLPNQQCLLNELDNM